MDLESFTWPNENLLKLDDAFERKTGETMEMLHRSVGPGYVEAEAKGLVGEEADKLERQTDDG